GSSIVPIMLIVILLVGAVVFVVVSSRSGRSGYDTRPQSRQRRSRHRTATIPLRDDSRADAGQPGAAGRREESRAEDRPSAQLDTDTLIPGLAPVPPPAATGTDTPLGDDVTALY